MKVLTRKFLPLAVLGLLLSACGGGNGTNVPDTTAVQDETVRNLTIILFYADEGSEPADMDAYRLYDDAEDDPAAFDALMPINI